MCLCGLSSSTVCLFDLSVSIECLGGLSVSTVCLGGPSGSTVCLCGLFDSRRSSWSLHTDGHKNVQVQPLIIILV